MGNLQSVIIVGGDIRSSPSNKALAGISSPGDSQVTSGVNDPSRQLQVNHLPLHNHVDGLGAGSDGVRGVTGDLVVSIESGIGIISNLDRAGGGGFVDNAHDLSVNDVVTNHGTATGAGPILDHNLLGLAAILGVDIGDGRGGVLAEVAYSPISGALGVTGNRSSGEGAGAIPGDGLRRSNAGAVGVHLIDGHGHGLDGLIVGPGSAGAVVQDDGGGSAILDHSAEVAAEGALVAVQPVQGVLQGVIAGADLFHAVELVAMVLSGQGQNDLDSGSHGEALGLGGVGVQSAVLEAQVGAASADAMVLNAAGAAVVVSIQQNGLGGLVVVSSDGAVAIGVKAVAVHSIHDLVHIVDEAVPTEVEVDVGAIHNAVVGVGGINLGVGLQAGDVALGIEADLIPFAALNTGVQVRALVVNLNQVDLLTIDDGIAVPLPLVVAQVILTLHAAGDVGVLSGSALVVGSQQDHADDVAVLVVEDVGLIFGVLVVVVIGVGIGIANSSVVGVDRHTVVVHGEVHVLHAGGDGVNVVHDEHGLVAVLHGDALHLSVDVNGVVVAVDAGEVAHVANALVCHLGAVQGDVLGVDVEGVGISVHGALGHLLGMVRKVGGIGAFGVNTHLFQGVNVIGVLGVGAPGVHLRQVSAAGGPVNLAVLGVHHDSVHGAVQEDDVDVGVLGVQVALAGVGAGDEHVLVGLLVQLQADEVAIGVQNDVVGDVLHVDVVVSVQHLHVIAGGVGVVILGAVGVDPVVLFEGTQGDLRQDLGGDHALNTAVSHGDQELVVLLHVLDGEVLAVDNDLGLVQILILDVDGAGRGTLVIHVVALQGNLVPLGVVVFLGDSQVGVDHGHIDPLNVLAVVHKHLSQHAFASAAHTVGVGADQAVGGEVGVVVVRVLQDIAGASRGGLHTVDGDVELVVVDDVSGQQIVQHTAGDLLGVLSLQQLLLHIGADGLAFELPGPGGTVEVVSRALVQLQAAVVQLLAQLHDGVVVGRTHGGGGHRADSLGIGLVAGDVDVVDLTGQHGAVGSGQVDGVAVGLNHAALQSVQHHLRHLITGHGSGGAGANALEDADGGALTNRGDFKAVGVVVLVLEVAQSAHHHGRGFHGGDGGGGIVDAVAAAGHDAVGGSSADPASGPVIHAAYVGKGTGGGIVVVIQVEQLAHNDSHLGAAHGVAGTEVAVLVADHYADRLHNLDGLDVVILGNIGVARSAGTNHHHAQEHDRSQSQAEGPLQVSHSDFLL